MVRDRCIKRRDRCRGIVGGSRDRGIRSVRDIANGLVLAPTLSDDKARGFAEMGRNTNQVGAGG